MPYMYRIRSKSDPNVGYIGQARGSEDTLRRIYEHIAGAYKISLEVSRGPFSFWVAGKEGNQKLYNLLNQQGACNCDYYINSNAADCYGAGIDSFNKFCEYWNVHRLGGAGRLIKEDPLEAFKLDFAEFILIFKYKDTLGAGQRAGSQSSFYYKTAKLAKVFDKINPSIAEALRNIDEQVAWKSEQNVAGDNGEQVSAAKVLKNDNDLLYPEAQVISFAFEKAIINYVMSPEQLNELFHEALKTEELVQKFGEAIIKKFFASKAFTTPGINTIKQSLTSLIKEKMSKFLHTNLDQWNADLKRANVPVVITMTDNDLDDKVKEIVNFLNKGANSVASGNLKLLKNLDWTFERKNVRAKLTSNPKTPEWFTAAKNFLNDFTVDATEMVKDTYIQHFKSLYMHEAEGQDHPSERMREVYSQATFIQNNWYMFFDPLINFLKEQENGPLVFTETLNPNLVVFGRQNVIDDYGNFIRFGIVSRAEQQQMLLNKTIIIW